MIGALRVIRAAARLQIAQLNVNNFMLFTLVLQPFFVAVTAMFMLRFRSDFDPLYVVVGAGLSGLWSAALFEGTWAIQSERWQGTLELVVASPAPMLLVLGGRMAGSMVFALLSMAVSYVVGAWLFGYQLIVRDPIGFVVALVFALLALWSMAMLFAPLSILGRVMARFLAIFEYPVYILGGFLFPILLLPTWSRPFSYVLPPYWAAVALHGTAAGDLDAPQLLNIVALLTVSAVATVLIARGLVLLALKRARTAGTLALS
ncbi:MAG: ABC transporter permease [Chloroflexota bacterium]|nr:ABC transporter permease [Chloroflexota bacterium]